MPKKTGGNQPEIQLTWKQVMAWRMRRHYLDRRASREEMLAVVPQALEGRILTREELAGKLRAQSGAECPVHPSGLLAGSLAAGGCQSGPAGNHSVVPCGIRPCHPGGLCPLVGLDSRCGHGLDQGTGSRGYPGGGRGDPGLDAGLTYQDLESQDGKMRYDPQIDHTLGEIRPDMTENEVITALGQPGKITEGLFMEDQPYKDFEYPGITIRLFRDPWDTYSAGDFYVTSRDYPSSKGVVVGDPQEKVFQCYGAPYEFSPELISYRIYDVFRHLEFELDETGKVKAIHIVATFEYLH